MDYLEFIKTCADAEALALNTADFLQTHIGAKNFVLIRNKRSINPFSLLIRSEDTFNFEQWKKSLSGKSISPLAGQAVLEQGLYYFFPEADYENDPFCFFVFFREPNAQTQRIMNQWSHVTALLTRVIFRTTKKTEIEQGTLVSQILHDINTLIAFQEPEAIDPDSHARIEYQKKVNEDLLFYIRPLEILPFKVSVEQLIESSLQFTELKKDNFLLTISADPAEITIDVELFSKAFNEIIFNAVRASKLTLSKIKITVELLSSVSPFVSFNWLQITVTDNGPGISPDYREHIYEPFFTTQKADGHSGFGLTNAKKIITALNGFLQINSVKGQGTEVKMFLPIL